MWTALLRDPQAPKSGVLTASISKLIPAFMTHVVKVRWEDVEEKIHPLSSILEESWDDEVHCVNLRNIIFFLCFMLFQPIF